MNKEEKKKKLIPPWFTIYNSLEDIKEQFGFTTKLGWTQKGITRSGSNNIVRTYIKKDEKISIRETIEPVFLVKDARIVLNTQFGLLTEKEKQEEINNRENWRLASEYSLSPKLYNYVYFKKQQDRCGNSQIFVCVISEGYSIDLETYYEDKSNYEYSPPPNGWKAAESTTGNGIYWYNKTSNESKFPEEKFRILSRNDKKIAGQLVKLLQKTSTIMKTICFDLKPANCVINIETYEVKLIDWDVDWCTQYNFINQKHDKSLAKLTGLLSTMFMANQFLKWVGWNIFAEYFAEKKYKSLLKESDSFYRRPLIPSLKTLYCSSLKVNHDTGYQLMAIHYQMDKIKPLFNNDNAPLKKEIKIPWQNNRKNSEPPTERLFKKKCDSIFDLFWERTLLLTENTKYVQVTVGGKKRGKRTKTRRRKTKRKKKTKRRRQFKDFY